MKLFQAMAIVLLFATLVGCQQATSSTSTSTAVTGISITAGTPSAGSVSGTTWTTASSGSQTLQLTGVLTPSGATGTVTWTTDDTADSHVTVNSSGLVNVTAYAEGTNGTSGIVVVTATVGSFSATFNVNTSAFPIVSPTSISITAGTPSDGYPSAAASISGSTWTTASSGTQTLQLTSVLAPSGATGTVTWSSSDTGNYDNVTVSSTGLVTDKGYAGTVTITATVGSYTATFTVDTNNWPN